MVIPRFSFGGRVLAVALLTAATLVAPRLSAGAAASDCQPPPSHNPAFGCVWAGPGYTGAMTLHDDGAKAATGCRDGSPRSAVNNSPARGGDRYSFAFYHHPACGKGGKPFGVLAPGSQDPDLPAVQSYAWTKYSG
jgi:hypothetical protein